MDEYRSPVKQESPRWRSGPDRRSFEKSLRGFVDDQFYQVETLDGDPDKVLVDLSFPDNKVGILNFDIAIVGRWQSGSAGADTDYSEVYLKLSTRRNKAGVVSVNSSASETNSSTDFYGSVTIDTATGITASTTNMNVLWDVYVKKSFALVDEQVQIFP